MHTTDNWPCPEWVRSVSRLLRPRYRAADSPAKPPPMMMTSRNPVMRNGPIFQFVAPANLTSGFVCMCGDDAKWEPRDSAYTAVNSAPNRNICDA
jgi:hypothetical protein